VRAELRQVSPFERVSWIFPQERLSADWRMFEVTTRVQILKSSGSTRVWLPAALLGETPYQKTFVNTFDAEGGTAKLAESKSDGLAMVVAEFPSGIRPVVTLKSRIATRNYAVDVSKPGNEPKENHAELEYFLRPTKLMPTDGIVKATANDIAKGAKTDVEKARAIYEWIVDNTFRNPKTRGCGKGDIRFMLESKDLGGRCADLNALYVGLARAAGTPPGRNLPDCVLVRYTQVRLGRCIVRRANPTRPGRACDKSESLQAAA
jgi:transglutaminase-like putative cysteine protease